MNESVPVASKSSHDGFELFTLRNSRLELSVCPALGAKVVSLKNLRTGREWMWRPSPELKLFANQPGEGFGRSTLVGWDECIPTVAPCTWRGRSFPDHGEVWSLPWELDAKAWERGVIEAAVRLPISGFSFSRTLSIVGNRVAARYELRHGGSRRSPESEVQSAKCKVQSPKTSGGSTYGVCEPQDFIWAAHPLLAVQEGDRLDLTDEMRELLGRPRWLDTLEFTGAAGCDKVYAGPLSEGRAGVFNARTGDRLTFEWDTAQNNMLGLWLTRGGWSGHHHLAVEPTNGAADSLAESAGELKRCGVVSGSQTKEWRMGIRLEP